ncbi:MAG: ABC transporter ATP-binding protein [Acholeplasmataceae bacterium]|jgi:ABC-2 type transport system ATP-binding protein|nr:ABC transporter ATP-binding protein [Acholeplasmataceae bacterium]
MNNYGLKINKLTVKLNGFTLNEIDFELPKGTILGIVGRNGAGKTTLIRSICGLYEYQSGEVFVNGYSRFSQEKQYLSQMKVMEDDGILNVFLKPKKINKFLKKSFPEFDEQFFLENLNNFGINLKRRLHKMSKGEQKKINILTVMSLNPDVLILDEPTANIDPISKREVISLLQDYLTENKTIIYSSNQTEELDKIADYVLFLENGNMLLYDTKDNLFDSHFIIAVTEKEFKELWEKEFIGYQKNHFGYEGIVKNKNLIDKYNLTYKLPSIEEIMYYYVKGTRQ